MSQLSHNNDEIHVLKIYSNMFVLINITKYRDLYSFY